MNYKLDSSLDDHIASLTDANNKLSDAYDILQEVKGMIDDGSWSGKSQKITMALCEICSNYHFRVMTKAKKETNVIKTLRDSAEEYMHSGKIPSEWR